MDRLGLDDYERGILAGDRSVLARAITLVESTLAADREPADELLRRLWPRTGAAQRVGITGVPGVGKSTFIEALGKRLLDRGQKVAVLAVDPSSLRSGGSILGDKTRMPELSRHPAAFVRPSPSRGVLGGVAGRTREALVLLDAAGYDPILVETVGVGQSELLVADMVDFFLVLVLAGAGDELQGIKRGILELADLVAVTKADGTNVAATERTRQDYAHALGLMEPRSPSWSTPVRTCSALTGDGLDAIWEAVGEHARVLAEAGEREGRRGEQRSRWLGQALDEGLRALLDHDPTVTARLQQLEAEVRAGHTIPTVAAAEVLAMRGVVGA